MRRVKNKEKKFETSSFHQMDEKKIFFGELVDRSIMKQDRELYQDPDTVRLGIPTDLIKKISRAGRMAQTHTVLFFIRRMSLDYYGQYMVVFQMKYRRNIIKYYMIILDFMYQLYTKYQKIFYLDIHNLKKPQFHYFFVVYMRVKLGTSFDYAAN